MQMVKQNVCLFLLLYPVRSLQANGSFGCLRCNTSVRLVQRNNVQLTKVDVCRNSRNTDKVISTFWLLWYNRDSVEGEVETEFLFRSNNDQQTYLLTLFTVDIVIFIN